MSMASCRLILKADSLQYPHPVKPTTDLHDNFREASIQVDPISLFLYRSWTVFHNFLLFLSITHNSGEIISSV